MAQLQKMPSPNPRDPNFRLLLGRDTVVCSQHPPKAQKHILRAGPSEELLQTPPSQAHVCTDTSTGPSAVRHAVHLSHRLTGLKQLPAQHGVLGDSRRTSATMGLICLQWHRGSTPRGGSSTHRDCCVHSTRGDRGSHTAVPQHPSLGIRCLVRIYGLTWIEHGSPEPPRAAGLQPLPSSIEAWLGLFWRLSHLN